MTPPKSTSPSAAKAQSVPSTGAVTAPDKLTLARSSPLPTELVQRACHLSGVTGALIATPDGLVIASQLPSSMNAEMAAGFLPQVYSRLGQYTRMGQHRRSSGCKHFYRNLALIQG